MSKYENNIVLNVPTPPADKLKYVSPYWTTCFPRHRTSSQPSAGQGTRRGTGRNTLLSPVIQIQNHGLMDFLGSEILHNSVCPYVTMPVCRYVT